MLHIIIVTLIKNNNYYIAFSGNSTQNELATFMLFCLNAEFYLIFTNNFYFNGPY